MQFKTTMNSTIRRMSTFLLLLGVFVVRAQTSQVISLEEVLAKARENNTSLKISEQELAMARGQYESSRAVILPQLRVSNTSSFTNNPLHAFGFKLVQRNVTAPDFDPDLLNDPGNVENYNTRIELTQPLINIDGWKERKMANLNVEAKNLQSQRTAEYVELETTKTYMQLQLAHQSVKVMESAKATAVQNQLWARNNLDQGLIQEADYLDILVRVTDIENKLQMARSSVQNASDYLSFLTGGQQGTLLSPEDELQMVPEDMDSEISLNMNRKDILALQYQVDAQEQMFQSSKMSFVPRANAMANYEWNDPTFMAFGANNYMVGIQLTWDIFSGYKNIGKVHREKALLEKVNLEQEKYLKDSELEIAKTRRQMADAKNQVELTGQSVAQSKEAYRIIENRYKQGLEKTKDLLFAESRYHEKELEHAKAIFNFNFSKIYLKFLTQ